MQRLTPNKFIIQRPNINGQILFHPYRTNLCEFECMSLIHVNFWDTIQINNCSPTYHQWWTQSQTHHQHITSDPTGNYEQSLQRHAIDAINTEHIRDGCVNVSQMFHKRCHKPSQTVSQTDHKLITSDQITNSQHR